MGLIPASHRPKFDSALINDGGSTDSDSDSDSTEDKELEEQSFHAGPRRRIVMWFIVALF
jgi:hypothetical protein